MTEKAIFVVECPNCQRNQGISESGRAEETGRYDDGEPFGARLQIGLCPECKTILAGFSRQLAFAHYDSEDDRWSMPVRVYPKPPKELGSSVPWPVRQSIKEAEKTLQADASTAACVMLGRALEALCNHALAKVATASQHPRKLTLAKGIEALKQKGIIDDRLFNWSQELRAFRNLAAHASGEEISRVDAEDLYVFVCAIVEYVYDLAERYDEFQRRQERRARRRAKP